MDSGTVKNITLSAREIGDVAAGLDLLADRIKKDQAAYLISYCAEKSSTMADNVSRAYALMQCAKNAGEQADRVSQLAARMRRNQF